MQILNKVKPLLSGHPCLCLLSAQLSKSQNYCQYNTAYNTLIKWPPLFNGCSHLRVLNHLGDSQLNTGNTGNGEKWKYLNGKTYPTAVNHIIWAYQLDKINNKVIIIINLL